MRRLGLISSRIRWRVRVRALMIGLAVFATWMGSLVRSTAIQSDAVKAVIRAGGAVKYDWEWKDGDEIVDGRPPCPKWLVEWLGVDYFGSPTLVAVGFNDRLVDQLASIRQLTRLRELRMFRAHLTDGDLANLGGLKNLRRLDLSVTPITGSGLRHLVGQTRLEVLDLYRTSITDATLAHVGRLANLRRLDLGDCRSVTDAGLVHVGCLTRLRELNVSNCGQITDAGLSQLSGLNSLERLSVENCGVTDRGLAEVVSKLHNLQELRLLGTRVSDAGLEWK